MSFSADDVVNLDFSDGRRTEIINKLKITDFDVVIIGGGITGAGVARDAIYRGLNVALIEKDDFAEGTSSRSSKLLHGGIRYLKTYELKLVEEATKERNWERDEALPHIVRPLQFITPVFGEKKDHRTGKALPPSSNDLNTLKIGLDMYDGLCNNQNYRPGEIIDDPRKIAEMEPEFNTDQLIGAGLFYDTNMDDARIVIETIKECVASGKCTALNYLKVIDFVHNNDGLVKGLKVVENDKFTPKSKHDPFIIKGNVVVNCTGIWVDHVLGTSGKEKITRPTKGIHFTIKIDDFKINHAFGISNIDDHRFFFILPREHWILVGTTDTFYDESLDKPVATQEDIDYLRHTVELLFPNAKIDNSYILGTYAGLRPLVVEPGKSESEISRKHICLEREDGLFTLVGGKFTTFRLMAADLMRKYILKSKKVDITRNNTITINKSKNIAKIPYKIALKHDEFEASEQFKAAKGIIDPFILDHLYIEFGKGALQIIEKILQDPNLGTCLLEDPDYPPKYFPWVKAEIIYIIQHEIPRHLNDVLCRRTEICWLVDPSKQRKIAESTTEVMGEMLDWDKKRKKAEIEFYLSYIKANSVFYKGEI
ncbi:MAG: glycerol-3-phosphate dehydrogenase/oxidase [Candidatus Helarchaeota archaeon]|nr:glycerol-3-phosphate dehydrogenase/oxidase [Candidatus Helarchaeota archaeon]